MQAESWVRVLSGLRRGNPPFRGIDLHGELLALRSSWARSRQLGEGSLGSNGPRVCEMSPCTHGYACLHVWRLLVCVHVTGSGVLRFTVTPGGAWERVSGPGSHRDQVDGPSQRGWPPLTRSGPD